MDMLLATGEQVSIALLSMALQAEGVAATSMTGPQVGIVTESAHGPRPNLGSAHRTSQTASARRPCGRGGWFSRHQHRQRRDPGNHNPGPRGFRHISGGLSGSAGADACEIYTDVPGVLTTDPRKVPEAQLMAQVSCDEMLELASLGAAVCTQERWKSPETTACL